MYQENFKIVIPVEVLVHTPEKPFCNQTLYPDCPCRQDHTLIQEIHTYVQEGLLTEEEATRTVQGRGL